MPKSAPRPPAADPQSAADFHALKPKALAALWQTTFGRPLPKGLKPPLAAHLLRFHHQDASMGGLSSPVAAYLATLLPKGCGRATVGAPAPARRLKPGTRLLRAWHGKTYTITVADPGFVYDGKTYDSLSVIARMITGTPWSGPVFFGLRKPSPARKSP